LPVFFVLWRHPPRPTLFPYTTLFRSLDGERLRRSFAGRMGHAIEPIIAPLGFDWQMGIGIISSFAAREVFVSTMSTVYNLGGDEDRKSTRLNSSHVKISYAVFCLKKK